MSLLIKSCLTKIKGIVHLIIGKSDDTNCDTKNNNQDEELNGIYYIIHHYLKEELENIFSSFREVYNHHENVTSTFGAYGRIFEHFKYINGRICLVNQDKHGNEYIIPTKVLDIVTNDQVGPMIVKYVGNTFSSQISSYPSWLIFMVAYSLLKIQKKTFFTCLNKCPHILDVFDDKELLSILIPSEDIISVGLLHPRIKDIIKNGIPLSRLLQIRDKKIIDEVLNAMPVITDCDEKEIRTYLDNIPADILELIHKHDLIDNTIYFRAYTQITNVQNT